MFILIEVVYRNTIRPQYSLHMCKSRLRIVISLALFLHSILSSLATNKAWLSNEYAPIEESQL